MWGPARATEEINGLSEQKAVFFIKDGGRGVLRASATQSRFSIWGQKFGRALMKTRFPCVFFIPDFHCEMENNKAARVARCLFGSCCFPFGSENPE